MVSPMLWRSKRFKELSKDAQLVFFYLLTCEHQNMAGVYRLPIAYGAHDLGWIEDEFMIGIEEVIAKGLVRRDAATDEVMIAQWFKFNIPKGVKTIKGVANILEKIESDDLREEAVQMFGEVVNKQAEEEARKKAEESGPPLPPSTSDIPLDQLLDNKRKLRVA